jgi:hypothetical protein
MARASCPRQAAAHQIKHGVVADPPDLGLMSYIRVVRATSIAGIVSDRDSASSIRDAQDTDAFAPWAFLPISTLLR